MVLAGVGHFRRRTKVQTSVLSLPRMLLLQQGQRADALHDVVFLSVAGCGIMNRGTRHGRRINLRSRHQAIKTALEHFRQPFVRADRNQSFGETGEFTESVRPSLLVSNGSLVGILDGEFGVPGKQAAEIGISTR